MNLQTTIGVKFLALSLFSLSWSAQAQDIGDPSCDRLMLVSAYSGNNVQIRNACDGSLVRNLDSDGYLRGPQAIALDPAGDLVVVSEDNNRLIRYHRETLTYDAVIAGDRPETGEIEAPPVLSPTGLSISPDGRMFAGSYSGQVVIEIDPATGQGIATTVAMARSGIEGPDTGMILDGNRLLVPGFDSSSIVEADINQPESDKVLVASGANGLNEPRTILQLPGGNLLVTSWRGNEVLEFNGSTGAFVKTVVTAIERPTGMAFESAEVLLVASDRSNDIKRVHLSDGQVLNTLASSIPGPTFILLLDKQASSLAENNAFWIIGVGQVEGKSIRVDEMNMTTGGQFGSALDPSTIDNVPWGSLAIDFFSCDDGQVTWNPVEPAFEAGSYPVTRLASDPFGVECNATGFGVIDNSLWMNGLWYGGPPRDGEGFSVNLIEGGLAIVTWYTYKP